MNAALVPENGGHRSGSGTGMMIGSGGAIDRNNNAGAGSAIGAKIGKESNIITTLTTTSSLMLSKGNEIPSMLHDVER